jgi:hypothetical protein
MIILIFLLPILSGCLLVHLLWSERDIKDLAVQAFLGIGVGLGLNSLSYFAYMLLFAGQHWFFGVQLATFLLMVALSIRQERRWADAWELGWKPIQLRPAQTAMLALSGLVFLVSLSSTASYILRRRQGDWDAWMMFNRAARFVYRDQSNWLQSFSRQMDPIFHADYPLFLAMNIASGWDTLGSETPHVPMIQSALFAVACAGLFVSALASTKSVGQAALGLIVLWGTPAVVNEGARELADLPLAYFFLAIAILIYLYSLHRKPGLLVLAGITAGLGAWTKNEGSVFVIAAGLAIAIAFLRERPWRPLLHYTAGLVLPLALTLYFKLFLAPPSDVLSNGRAQSIAQALDIPRHLEILRYFAGQLLTFGGWSLLGLPIGMFALLLVYWLLVHTPRSSLNRPMVMATATMLAIQMLGYYAVYVITPYDLTWHLTTSVERVFLQIFPLAAFFILLACRTPEDIFSSSPVENS